MLWEETTRLLRDILSGDGRENRNLLDTAFHGLPENPSSRLLTHGAPQELAIEWVRKLWRARCIHQHHPLARILNAGYDGLRPPHTEGFANYDSFLDALNAVCTDIDFQNEPHRHYLRSSRSRIVLALLAGAVAVLSTVFYLLPEMLRNIDPNSPDPTTETVADKLECAAPLREVYNQFSADDNKNTEPCGLSPPPYADLEQGAALHAVLTGCKRSFTDEDNLFLAGMSEALANECGLPVPWEERFALMESLRCRGYSDYFGQRWSTILHQEAQPQIWDRLAYIAGTDFTRILGCGDPLARWWTDRLLQHWSKP